MVRVLLSSLPSLAAAAVKVGIIASLALQSQADARKLVSYFQSWATWDMSTVNWTGVDIFNYAFAVPSGNQVILPDGSDGPKLAALVDGAHQRGKKVVLSVGGWTNGGFSEQVMPANRDEFINSIKTIIAQYDLDGIDIDWEYPNDPGAGHTYSPDDTANLQAFLPRLRKALGTTKLITMAVPQKPWLDANGVPSKNLTQAANALSFIFLMEYDTSWNIVGPNSPFQNKCGKSYYVGGVESIALWRNAGFASSKIVFGVPFYGYNYVTDRTSFLRRRHGGTKSGTHGAARFGYAASHLLGHRALDGADIGSREIELDPRTAAAAAAAVLADPASSSSSDSASTAASSRSVTYTNMQALNFRQLIEDGTLIFNKTSQKWVGGNGYRRSWDSCSSTPFLRRNGSVIAYDDAESIFLKGKLAGYKNLYGAGTWALQADYQGQLTDALRRGIDAA